MPFVENAVKHGASSVGHSYISVTFHVNEKNLHFTAENSKPVIKSNLPGGLGLKNIMRRLSLLYPGKHELTITDTKEKYIVNLILPL
jgi:LytS/YehU family sensor histidine kinase